MRSPADGMRPRRREVLRFAAAFGGSHAWRRLANPTASACTGHVANLLVSSGVTKLIVEYQPPPFGKPDAEVLEWVLLALMPCRSSRRGGSTDISWPMCWCGCTWR